MDVWTTVLTSAGDEVKAFALYPSRACTQKRRREPTCGDKIVGSQVNQIWGIAIGLVKMANISINFQLKPAT